MLPPKIREVKKPLFYKGCRAYFFYVIFLTFYLFLLYKYILINFFLINCK